MRWAAIAVIAMTASAHADDRATSEALFLQAKELVKQGDYAGACPLYEQSFKLDPTALGAEINLADCHEHVGLLATAWGEYHDVEDRAHRAHDDTREAYAKEHGEALEPRLSKLKIDKPASPVPGLVVKRDGNDVTAILGVPMPVDAGKHAIEVSAPGYATQTVEVAISGEGKVVTLALPQLAQAAARAGHLTVDSQPDADITLDGSVVGHGRFDGPVTTGRHTLRVTATGMHPYQSDVYVQADENRTVAAQLDREGVVASGPSFSLAASMAPGVKLHGDSPALLAYRGEASFRIGQRVDLGLFVEGGSIRASGNCGTDLPSSTSGPFDFGNRTQFNSCRFVMPGLELLVHVLPGGRFDPYAGLAPAFRATFIDYTPVSAVGQAMNRISETWPSIVAGGVAGVDYHPARSAWLIGVYMDVEVTVIGQENSHGDSGQNVSYASLLWGVRGGAAF